MKWLKRSLFLLFLLPIILIIIGMQHLGVSSGAVISVLPIVFFLVIVKFWPRKKGELKIPPEEVEKKKAELEQQGKLSFLQKMSRGEVKEFFDSI